MLDREERLEHEPEASMALGPLVGLAREDFFGAAAHLAGQAMSKPEAALRLWQAYSADLFQIATGSSDLCPHPKDRRFKDDAWDRNPFFKASAQAYLAFQKTTENWIDDLDLQGLERDRASFISRILVDALSPTNAFVGNPAAQKRAIETGGTSLLKGVRNAFDDMVNNDGLVKQVDKKPFKLGENIAASAGAVVFKNEMMELIHYAPQTAEVYSTPQLIIPPQINKMYIFDLAPEKSIVKWLVDNGIQSFIISWRNPNPDQGHWGISDYVACCEQAIEVIQEITGSNKVNVTAACSGGQTTSLLASKLAAEHRSAIGAITLMVCVLHPIEGDTEAGSLMSDNGLALARQRAKKKGDCRSIFARPWICLDASQRSDLELCGQQLSDGRRSACVRCFVLEF